MKVEQFKVTGAIDTHGKIRDFGVANGKIVEVNEASGPVIDASGLQLLPGLVDLHTHLREPGYEQSETIATGSKSAAMGGFTAVHAMANTFPVNRCVPLCNERASMCLNAALAKSGGSFSSSL